jgi:SWI/SNF-related matrix-associated actin-dependent regulator of chromatin subfamily A-like protein 1
MCGIPVVNTLLPHQKIGLDFLRSRQRSLLADEMGLGKTIQAIALINSYATRPNILVICPALVRGVWVDELKQWLYNPYTIIRAESGYLPLVRVPSITIISYDATISPKVMRYIMAKTYGLVICDESHYLKNHSAKRTQAVLAGGIKATQWLFMSGTPITNSPLDIWPILAAACPKALGEYQNFGDFANRYTHVVTGGKGGVRYLGAKNENELNDRLKGFMLRRTKQEVLKDLPDIFHQPIFLAPDKTAEKLLQVEQDFERAIMLKDLTMRDPKQAASLMRHADKHVMTARRLLGVEKLPHVLAHVKNVLEQQDKVVVFCHHQELFQALHNAFKEEGYMPAAVSGGSGNSTLDREKQIKIFQQQPECRVFLGSIGACSTGITLTAASHIIFAEMAFLPSEMEQAAARCHRIGQKKNVLVQYMVWSESLEHWIFTNVLRKSNSIEKIIGNKE